MSRSKEFAHAGEQILPYKIPAVPFTQSKDNSPIVAVTGVVLIAICIVMGFYQGKERYVSLDRNLSSVFSMREGAGAFGATTLPFAGSVSDQYRDIFALQKQEKFKQADQLIAGLRDKSLMGHVLAHRYLQTNHPASFLELESWLKSYADLPQSAQIERLARARMPQGYKGVLQPSLYKAPRIEEMAPAAMLGKTYVPLVERTSSQNAEAKALIAQIRQKVEIYEPTEALGLLEESPASAYLDTVEQDRLKALIASGYLYAGKLVQASALSSAALRASGEKAPLAGWIEGLVAWQLGDYHRAVRGFESAAHSDYSSGPLVSSASFWAFRAHKVLGERTKGRLNLERAASYSNTFYGLLASATLGRKADIDWHAPRSKDQEVRALLETPAGQRAERLLSVGQVALAEREIRSLYVSGDHVRKEALLAYASQRNMPSLTLQLAHALDGGVDRNERANAASLYPVMPWSPSEGYRIDRALLHAIARQESRFDAAASSRSGALGLMQLMPRTASHVAGKDLFAQGKKGASLLKDPQSNLDLGQKYVEELLNSDVVGQDLLSLAMAYNAGPGTLSRWKSERAHITDPLLFIETIPYAETRSFSQKVLANYWIYRQRFNQPIPSLFEMAQGNWARYVPMDDGAARFASR